MIDSQDVEMIMLKLAKKSRRGLIWPLFSSSLVYYSS